MTTYNRSRIKSLCGMPEVTFSTSPITNFGTSGVFRVPAEKMGFEPDQEFIARAAQNDSLVTESGIIGGKAGKLSFETDIPGLLTSGTGVPAPYPWQSKLFQSAGLAETLGTGSTIDTAATTTSLPLATGGGTGWIAGMLVGVVNAAGFMEARIVTAVSTDTLTVSPALSGAPADGAVVYGAACYRPSDVDPGTMTFIAKGDGYEYTLTGCKAAAPKFTVTARGLPKMAWSFDVDSWSVTTTSGTLPALPASKGIVAKKSAFFWGTGSTPTPAAEWSFDPGMALAPKFATEGGEGRAGFAVTDAKPTASAKVYYASAFRTDYVAGTARTMLAQLGSVAGACFAVGAETVQIMKFPAEKDVGGLVGHEIAFSVNVPATLTNPYAFGVL